MWECYARNATSLLADQPHHRRHPPPAFSRTYGGEEHASTTMRRATVMPPGRDGTAGGTHSPACCLKVRMMAYEVPRAVVFCCEPTCIYNKGCNVTYSTSVLFPRPLVPRSRAIRFACAMRVCSLWHALDVERLPHIDPRCIGRKATDLATRRCRVLGYDSCRSLVSHHRSLMNGPTRC